MIDGRCALIRNAKVWGILEEKKKIQLCRRSWYNKAGYGCIWIRAQREYSKWWNLAVIRAVDKICWQKSI
jgi:hypothetical protein